MPLLAVIANKTLWPLWALISLAGAMFPLLLCPVYVNFISRMGLAWSLDRQLPEWFGVVNERMAAPLNAILATLGLTAVFLWLAELRRPAELDRAADRQAEPGGDALVLDLHGRADVDHAGGERDPDPLPQTRPGAKRAVPASALPWLGVAWIVFPIWIYWFAAIKPIWENLTTAAPAGWTT